MGAGEDVESQPLLGVPAGAQKVPVRTWKHNWYHVLGDGSAEDTAACCLAWHAPAVAFGWNASRGLGTSWWREALKFLVLTLGVFMVLRCAACGLMMAFCGGAPPMMMPHGDPMHPMGMGAGMAMPMDGPGGAMMVQPKPAVEPATTTNTGAAGGMMGGMGKGMMGGMGKGMMDGNGPDFGYHRTQMDFPKDGAAAAATTTANAATTTEGAYAGGYAYADEKAEDNDEEVAMVEMTTAMMVEMVEVVEAQVEGADNEEEERERERKLREHHNERDEENDDDDDDDDDKEEGGKAEGGNTKKPCPKNRKSMWGDEEEEEDDDDDEEEKGWGWGHHGWHHGRGRDEMPGSMPMTTPGHMMGDGPMAGECMERAVPWLCALGAVTISVMLYAMYWASLRRTALRERFGIAGSRREDCLLWACCAPCTLAQETRTLMHNNVVEGVWQGPHAGYAAVYGAPVAQEQAPLRA
uniref:PLAC8 family protein n=1 Tax=Chlamydomonas leiostraca TaxID=1034604 RepID=A0A7S0WWC7_9CHLO|mmetsp:Transcript_32264/g.81984  ORF Transcript_32264/g.81984 Transcript_32264/m.81984 type:complete len:466 (+) Transcript_32264:162-1559(+)|eukprot:CAMPEP_0202872742 /NCGR_PEP_ID=MMETSP1391-20130828/21889_1 /ASSEMBLY_ACC=CAM_ASM_000867 /TAXON_ID=1034604 /ORGANISM="Chlamydomonas leiostraca, Strain SAG 11-49" /LENGTH=465 /DNA_ID=CAMNT_0049553865 /DNA_START=131 /DNA_END=1528 /DNA_ORIENTATION=+